MKTEVETKSNLSVHHSNGTNNHNIGILGNQRKGAVHDLTQLLVEDCQKLMSECQKLISKYHTNLLIFSNGHLNESTNHREELKTLRIQSYLHMKTSLEKLLPQVDQVSINDNELSKYIQQIISYLEYLKFEFVRHLYLLKSHSMQQSEKSRTNIASKSSDLNRPDFNLSAESHHKRTEINDIQKDINEIEITIYKLSQKYYMFIPDLEDIKIWNKKDGKSASNSQTFQMFSKCKFICCFCSPKYI